MRSSPETRPTRSPTTGGIVWRYRYRLNGKYEKLTLGKYPALTLKNARLSPSRDHGQEEGAIGRCPSRRRNSVQCWMRLIAWLAWDL
uniref:Arm DNA-binding domain-containing protein n=1 Tax=Castellaniella caeni TaxID=266123 RepID=UPI001E56F06F|nr:Arm DNA-binding domain-containing protein [Castellaniella caeni]